MECLRQLVGSMRTFAGLTASLPGHHVCWTRHLFETDNTTFAMTLLGVRNYGGRLPCWRCAHGCCAGSCYAC